MLQTIKNQLRNYPYIFFIILFLFFGFYTNHLFAQTASGLEGQLQNSLNDAGTVSGYGETYQGTPSTISYTIGLIISYILGFIGVIFLVIIIYSGFQWMTAGGNEETVAKAKKRLTNAVIGLVIIFTAYLITYFITEVLITTTQYES
jgi:hypothetical protein